MRFLGKSSVFTPFFAATLALSVSGGCKPGSNAAAKGEQTPPVPVSVARAERRAAPMELQEIGWVEPIMSVGVRPQVSGTLLMAHFTEGQEVKKDALLFTIDPRPFEASLRQAEANLARDEAQLKNARIELERTIVLYDKGIAARDRLDAARTAVEVLAAATAADAAQIDNARLQLGYCYIRSPIPGLAGAIKVDPGNYVRAGDVDLVTINQMRPTRVVFSVAERYLGEVRKRAAGKELPLRALIPGSAEPEQGVLTFIDNTVDRGAGTIKLRGAFENASGRLWPSQFVIVSMTLAVDENALAVPSQAVQMGQQGHYVYVVVEKEREGKRVSAAEQRPVKIGRDYEGYTTIESGLAGDETVITEGQFRLVADSLIEIKNANTEGRQQP